MTTNISVRMECQKRGMPVFMIDGRYLADGSPGQLESATICENHLACAAELLEKTCESMFCAPGKQVAADENPYRAPATRQVPKAVKPSPHYHRIGYFFFAIGAVSLVYG